MQPSGRQRATNPGSCFHIILCSQWSVLRLHNIAHQYSSPLRSVCTGQQCGAADLASHLLKQKWRRQPHCGCMHCKCVQCRRATHNSYLGGAGDAETFTFRSNKVVKPYSYFVLGYLIKLCNSVCCNCKINCKLNLHEGKHTKSVQALKCDFMKSIWGQLSLMFSWKTLKLRLKEII